MKRSLLVVLAALALSLGLSVPASAANPHASCAGLAASSLAGQPGARAEIQFGEFGVFATAAHEGVPPGAVASGFAHFHEGSAEVCFA
jgi:hypothetical protein